jgi:hypothetical protein
MQASAFNRQLTPSQHATIRRGLALIPVCIWIAYAWSVFALHLPAGPLASRSHVTRDFVHFYTQAVITREHDAHALYDIDAMAAVASRVMPVPVTAKFPPVYGPQVGLLLSPLASLDYVQALLLWLSITVALYTACVALVWRGEAPLRGRGVTTVVLALGAAGLHFTLSFGQISIVGLLCMTALWFALRSGRLFLAGIAIGALAYKPPLGIVAACVFVAAAEWRIVVGALVAIAVQLGAAVAYWGPAIISSYVGALRRLPAVVDVMEPDKALMHSWRAMFVYLGIDSTAATLLSLALSAATIAAAIVCWRQRGPLALRYTVLAVSTLLVNPHSYAYDLLLLTPALIVAWSWAEDERTHGSATNATCLFALLAFVYVAPLLTIAMPAVPLQWSVVASAALVLFCASLRPASRRVHDAAQRFAVAPLTESSFATSDR